MTGEITVQIPGSEARIEAALNAWSVLYPDDDLATHIPGRHTQGLAQAWTAEIDALTDDIVQLEAARDTATYQRAQYLKGSSGEVRVGQALNALHKHGWGILHSLPIYDARADIDHLLIGPGGIWTVNAKAHPRVDMIVDGDRLTIGRTRVDYVPAARIEAAMVGTVLRRHGIAAEVKPCVIFDAPPDSTSRTIKEPQGVKLMALRAAMRFFTSLERVLDHTQVNEAFAVARQRTTWEGTES
jgi:hypothetical protein